MCGEMIGSYELKREAARVVNLVKISDPVKLIVKSF